MLCCVKKKAPSQPESTTEQNKYNHWVNTSYDSDRIPHLTIMIWFEAHPYVHIVIRV